MKINREFSEDNCLILSGRKVGYFECLEMFACLMEQDEKAKKDFRKLGFKNGGEFIERLTKY